jgi:hypothetical protein
MVRLAGVEPAASAMSTRRSAVELEARAPGTIRTRECRYVKPMPWATWRRERIGALGKIRTSTVRGLKPPPPTVGLPARTRGGHRTRTVRRLRPGFCRLGYAGEHKRASTPVFMQTTERSRPFSKFGASGGIRTRTVFLLREAPPASWATDAKMVLPASLELASPPYQSGDLPHDREERNWNPQHRIERASLQYKAEALLLKVIAFSDGKRCPLFRKMLQLSYAGMRASGLPGSRFRIGAGGRELNPQPLAYEALALPLCYASNP